MKINERLFWIISSLILLLIIIFTSVKLYSLKLEMETYPGNMKPLYHFFGKILDCYIENEEAIVQLKDELLQGENGYKISYWQNDLRISDGDNKQIQLDESAYKLLKKVSTAFLSEVDKENFNIQCQKNDYFSINVFFVTDQSTRQVKLTYLKNGLQNEISAPYLCLGDNWYIISELSQHH